MNSKHLGNIISNYYNTISHCYNTMLLNSVRKRIIKKYSKFDNKEIKGILNFLKTHQVEMISYDFTQKFNPKDIKVYSDCNLGYRYVFIDDSPVYFPKEMSDSSMQNAVSIALKEQDKDSPHKYLSNEFNLSYVDIAVLVGASDGIMALSIIEKTKKYFCLKQIANG